MEKCILQSNLFLFGTNGTSFTGSVFAFDRLPRHHNVISDDLKTSSRGAQLTEYLMIVVQIEMHPYAMLSATTALFSGFETQPAC